MCCRDWDGCNSSSYPGRFLRDAQPGTLEGVSELKGDKHHLAVDGFVAVAAVVGAAVAAANGLVFDVAAAGEQC